MSRITLDVCIARHAPKCTNHISVKTILIVWDAISDCESEPASGFTLMNQHSLTPATFCRCWLFILRKNMMMMIFTMTSTRLHTHTHVQTHAHHPPHTPTHTCACARAHACTRARTPTHTHARMHARTHTSSPRRGTTNAGRQMQDDKCGTTNA